MLVETYIGIGHIASPSPPFESIIKIIIEHMVEGFKGAFFES